MRLRRSIFKVPENGRRYSLQVVIATSALFCVFMTEQVISGGEAARAVVVAAIASTAFVLFITPFSPSASARHAIGGHLVAILVAAPLALIADNTLATQWIIEIPSLFALYAASGVGVSMFMMATTNTEHPPAAGTALAILVHGFSWNIILFVVIAVLMLVLLHWILRTRLTTLY